MVQVHASTKARYLSIESFFSESKIAIPKPIGLGGSECAVSCKPLFDAAREYYTVSQIANRRPIDDHLQIIKPRQIKQKWDHVALRTATQENRNRYD